MSYRHNFLVFFSPGMCGQSRVGTSLQVIAEVLERLNASYIRTTCIINLTLLTVTAIMIKFKVYKYTSLFFSPFS